MQIGVDATAWQNNRGYGRHARALLSSLVRLDAENHYTFLVDSADGIESMPGHYGMSRLDVTDSVPNRCRAITPYLQGAA